MTRLHYKLLIILKFDIFHRAKLIFVMEVHTLYHKLITIERNSETRIFGFEKRKALVIHPISYFTTQPSKWPYMPSPTTAAAWKRRPDGTCESAVGVISDHVCVSKSKLRCDKREVMSSRAQQVKTDFPRLKPHQWRSLGRVLSAAPPKTYKCRS